jgi:hypothetical protein
MVSVGQAGLAGIVMTIGIVAIAGTNFAFALQTPCGEQPYVYNVGCMPLNNAQMVGGVVVASIIGFAIACGVAGRHHNPVHSYI